MKLVHEILQSEKGKEMWSSVAPIYNNDAYNLYIFEAIGTVLDDFTSFIESLDEEVFPQSSTWSLALKEELHGIEPDGRLTREQRIQNLIEEMNRYQTMTRTNLENIINAHVQNKSAVVHDTGNYHFVVEIPGDMERDIGRIIQAIERNKPAHLEYLFKDVITFATLLSAVSIGGERVEVFPGIATTSKSQGLISLFSSSQSTEELTAKPKQVTDTKDECVARYATIGQVTEIQMVKPLVNKVAAMNVRRNVGVGSRIVEYITGGK